MSPKKKSTAKKSSLKSVYQSVVQQADKDFSSALPDQLSGLKTKYLGKKGLVSNLLREIGKVDEKERGEFGKLVHDLKLTVEDKLERLSDARSRQLTGEAIAETSFDPTAPFAPNAQDKDKPRFLSGEGTKHPLTSVGEKAIEIFETMGFHVTEPRRLDSDYHVFEALNIPKGHPARDMWDTFWTNTGLIPITHTSAMQHRILTAGKPPIREIIVGKCFRHEATDASHEHTFYQLEGMYVDRDITLTDLIGTLSSFMNAFYGREVKYKIQPSYFPFVEPGLEFLIECMVCGQQGCQFCHYSKWVELVPCGPIHPNVLQSAGLDSGEYTGFAWGLGFDRLVLLRNQISDIRYLHSGDLTFLEQFI